MGGLVGGLSERLGSGGPVVGRHGERPAPAGRRPALRPPPSLRRPGAGPQGVLARGGLQGQQGGELDGGGRRSVSRGMALHSTLQARSASARLAWQLPCATSATSPAHPAPPRCTPRSPSTAPSRTRRRTCGPWWLGERAAPGAGPACPALAAAGRAPHACHLVMSIAAWLPVAGTSTTPLSTVRGCWRWRLQLWSRAPARQPRPRPCLPAVRWTDPARCLPRAEALLREYCNFSKEERCIGDAMIGGCAASQGWRGRQRQRRGSGLESLQRPRQAQPGVAPLRLALCPSPCRPADTAVLGPKVALVSTLSSMSPAPPFLFRTYQLPPGSEALAAQIGAHAGKSPATAKHAGAVRRRSCCSRSCCWR